MLKSRNEKEQLQEELLEIWDALSNEKKEIAIELLKRLRDKEWEN